MRYLVHTFAMPILMMSGIAAAGDPPLPDANTSSPIVMNKLVMHQTAVACSIPAAPLIITGETGDIRTNPVTTKKEEEYA